MLANIRAQPLGPATVGDLALPDDFLRRFADRVVRASFESNLRLVVSDADPKSVAPGVEAPATGANRSTPPAPRAAEGRATWLYFGAGACGLLLIGWLVVRRRSHA